VQLDQYEFSPIVLNVLSQQKYTGYLPPFHLNSNGCDPLKFALSLALKFGQQSNAARDGQRHLLG
jgi:hypothetical protein